MRPRVSHDPREFLSCHHTLVRVWVLFKLFCTEQFAARSVCETPTREFNHSSAKSLHLSCVSFEFFLVFFVALAGISLLGEVNRVVTQLITRGVCGAKIAGCGF